MIFQHLPQKQLLVLCHFFIFRQQILYNSSVDPEAKKKIQKRAERFKASLNARSSTPTLLTTIQSMVGILLQCAVNYYKLWLEWKWCVWGIWYLAWQGLMIVLEMMLINSIYTEILKIIFSLLYFLHWLLFLFVNNWLYQRDACQIEIDNLSCSEWFSIIIVVLSSLI